MGPLLRLSQQRLPIRITDADPRGKGRFGVFIDFREFCAPLLQQIGLLIGVVEGLLKLRGRNGEPSLMEHESLL
jgi:hypothetical protein